MMFIPEEKKDNATFYKRTDSVVQCTYTDFGTEYKACLHGV